MYATLKEINRRPGLFESNTAETLWNDPYISKQMLALHLDGTVDPASRNKAFMDKSLAWMIDHFAIGPGLRLCDFGCGPGLYTTAFAEKGADVTGIDFSERSIDYAKEMAGQKNLSVTYILQNYLTFAPDRQFDLITMIYCDYCPLSPAQRKTMLRIFYDSLADGGCLFLDVFSFNAFKKRKELAIYGHQLLDGFWSAEDYYGFMNTYKYDKEHVILDKYTISEPSRTWEVCNWLQYFSPASLKKEFAQSGFRIVEQYADVAGKPLRPGSPEIAVVAKKI